MDDSIISYADNFEDVLLRRVFPRGTPGFYIDVGAFDPVALSVTKHFSDAGWRGINIEPVPALYRAPGRRAVAATSTSTSACRTTRGA